MVAATCAGSSNIGTWPTPTTVVAWLPRTRSTNGWPYFGNGITWSAPPQAMRIGTAPASSGATGPSRPIVPSNGRRMGVFAIARSMPRNSPAERRSPCCIVCLSRVLRSHLDSANGLTRNRIRPTIA